jgi:hypothetical protein
VEEDDKVMIVLPQVFSHPVPHCSEILPGFPSVAALLENIAGLCNQVIGQQTQTKINARADCIFKRFEELPCKNFSLVDIKLGIG